MHRDFYNLPLGSWVTLVFVGLVKFKISIKNRHDIKVRIPTFSPPMKFSIDKSNLSTFAPRPFTHNEFNFQVTYEKTLTSAEIESGILVYYKKNLFDNCLLAGHILIV